MIRVLHVLGELRPSGMEKMMTVAAPFWAAREISCEIVSTGEQTGPYRDILAAAGYPIIHVPFDRSHPFSHLLGMWRCFKSKRWNAVHIHTEQAMTYYAVLAYMAGIPVQVLTKHSVFPYTGALRRLRTLQRRFIRFLGGRFVAISPSVRDDEMRRYGNPCRWIRNWIDVAAFEPAGEAMRLQRRRELQLPADKPILLTAGNCAPVKNHKMLLHALADLKRENTPFFYVHLGLEERENERALARELGLADDCRFEGAVDDVSRYMQSADVFVQPSLTEGFGNAGLEALSCGLLAVFTRVPGLVDFGADFDSVIYTDVSRESLATGLRKALRHFADNRDASARRHHEIARALFAPEHGVAAYADLYRLYITAKPSTVLFH
jgi:glycosyltransferase involved in cell wall biosynthesis